MEREADIGVVLLDPLDCNGGHEVLINKIREGIIQAAYNMCPLHGTGCVCTLKRAFDLRTQHTFLNETKGTNESIRMIRKNRKRKERTVFSGFTPAAHLSQNHSPAGMASTP